MGSPTRSALPSKGSLKATVKAYPGTSPCSGVLDSDKFAGAGGWPVGWVVAEEKVTGLYPRRGHIGLYTRSARSKHHTPNLQI